MKKTIYTLIIVSTFLTLSCARNTYKDDTSAVSKIRDITTSIPKTLPTELPIPIVTTTAKIELHSNNNSSPLSYSEKDWNYRVNSTHDTPEISTKISDLLKKYSAYYVGDTNSKTLYLTFDEGYENGYTSKILDTLKTNAVPAAFFVTLPYITSQPELIKRMTNEGHIVANHSHHHPSMAEKARNKASFDKEFTNTEIAYKDITGKDMPKFFRPPMGKFSEQSLYLTQKLGYKTIFWSFAHADWEINKQPENNKAYDKIMKRIHNGAIILLHAVSKTNTEILDKVIKDLKSQGYSFKSLNELP